MHKNRGQVGERELAAGTADNGTCHYLFEIVARTMARQTCENVANLSIAGSGSLRYCKVRILGCRCADYVSGSDIELDGSNPQFGRVVEKAQSAKLGKAKVFSVQCLYSHSGRTKHSSVKGRIDCCCNSRMNLENQSGKRRSRRIHSWGKFVVAAGSVIYHLIITSVEKSEN